MEAYRARLVDQLVRAGVLTDPAWRAAVETVPREVFVPRLVWLLGDDGWYTARELDADQRLELAYDARLTPVTQVDDLVDARPGDRGRCPSSSATMPELVVTMLEELEVSDGQRVLEIGTGSGYSAALLAARLGDDQVVTVEVDPAVAAAAGEALTTAGYKPCLVTGDGAAGWPDGAPYDRVIATCSVRWIPYAWVEQTRPGGLILAPLAGPFGNQGLVRLDVRGDGTAAGRLLARDVAFMRLRAHRPAGRPDQAERFGDPPTRPITLDPEEFIGDRFPAWVAGLPVIDADASVGRGEDESASYWLEADDGSLAVVDMPQQQTAYVGPRDLWGLVEDTWRWWVEAGRPGPWTFGITVTPERQWIWHESGRIWELPA
ncbi:hypothetical protein TH66_14560 [Carbonactinospora thermoautotrophica]|uniref:Protein-L-isoaspartate O-methyltransferase n=2 Tax=Carbonactinospora thermoautotrophica TaxID=1469144 RepID=A0A132MS09_9ACTN|nr:hypothetical protein TH66_14560 [Carbonactinospora thermoautotrophica]